MIPLQREEKYHNYATARTHIFTIRLRWTFQGLCVFSLEILPPNKVISFLKINEQVIDNELFIKNNIKKIEKCFEKDKYSFLSNFHLNQTVCNYFISNSFKIKFNANKELSSFDKLFEKVLKF